MSSSSSLISLSPIILCAVASTLPITLIFLPIFLAPRLLNATRSDRGGGGNRGLSRSISVGLGLASTVSLVLYGICGLISISDGSLSAAIAGGMFGVLGLVSNDVQVAISTLWSEKRESGRKTRNFWWISIVSLLLLLTTGLEVALLALDQPQEKILFNITHSRGIFHLVFDVLIISVLLRQLIKSLEREKSKQDIESQRGIDTSTIGLSESKNDQAESRSRVSARRERVSSILSHRETFLIALQLLSALLSILSVSLPILSNYVPFDSSGSRFVPPTIFGSTTTPAGSITVSAIVVMRWTGSFFGLASQPSSHQSCDLENQGLPELHHSKQQTDSSDQSTTLQPQSTIATIDFDKQGSTYSQDAGISERPLMSRRQSFSSTLSFGANVPPPISEEGEHSKGWRSSGSTDHHEDYLHSETLPAPFVEGAEEEEEPEEPEVDNAQDGSILQVDSKRSTSFTSNRPRSASSPDLYQPTTPPIALRTRKDARRLPPLRPQLRRSPSSLSSISNVSPLNSRPGVKLSLEEENTFHTAPSFTPARRSESRASSSSQSPSKSRRPSLRSLAGFPSPRPGDSPNSTRKLRRGSRSSSISFLHGRNVEDGGAVTPGLEIETDEDDPFSAVQASQAIEAARKVEEWAKRRTDVEGGGFEDGGGFEEEIEIISPTRQNFDRLVSPTRLTTSSLHYMKDPSLFPRRTPSSSNSLFTEHLDDSQELDLPAHLRKNHSSITPRKGSFNEGGSVRSGRGLGSAFSFNATIALPSQSTPYRFGKSFSKVSLSPTTPPATSAKLLEVTGVHSNSALPPRADSPDPSRPTSTQVVKAEESPEQLRARSRSSAPPPTSPSLSPTSARIRKFFPSRPSKPLRQASSPPTISYSAPLSPQSRKGSRASSTLSAASFSLSRFRRKSLSGMLGPSIEGSQASSFRVSASSDLSFACRGEVSSSKRSSGQNSRSRSASFSFLSPSKPGSIIDKEDADSVFPATPNQEPSSPTLTSSWWNQENLHSPRPLTPYRRSPHRHRGRGLSAASAPNIVSAMEEPFEVNGSEEEEGSQGVRRGRHTRSHSLPLNRLSSWQLDAPVRISPIGSLNIDFSTEIPPVLSTSLAAPIDLEAPSIKTKSSSARSSLSRLQINHGNGHPRDRTISEGHLNELTELYETFGTPLEVSAAPSSRSSLDNEYDSLSRRDRRFTSSPPLDEVETTLQPSSFNRSAPIQIPRPATPIPSVSPITPSTFASTRSPSWSHSYTPSSPTSTQIYSESSIAASPTHSSSSMDYTSRISTDSNPGASINYWLHKRSSWLENEEECLEATGESEQMI